MSEGDIVRYLKRHHGRLCGRVNVDMLNRPLYNRSVKGGGLHKWIMAGGLLLGITTAKANSDTAAVNPRAQVQPSVPEKLPQGHIDTTSDTIPLITVTPEADSAMALTTVGGVCIIRPQNRVMRFFRRIKAVLKRKEE